MNPTITQKKLVIIAAILILPIVVLSVFYWAAQQANTYDSWLKVSNLSDYTQKTSLNKKAIDYMEYDLHQTVSMNTEGNIDSNSIDDFMVREGTFSEESDDLGIHTVEFIVDSESIKQSYGIFYQWVDSSDPTVIEDKSSHMQHWRTAVNCLPSDKLIYPAFNCIDMSAELSGDSSPSIAVLNWGTEDSLGNQVSSQLEFHEQYFIEYQILGEYISRHKLNDQRIPASIVGQPKREVVEGNTLTFTLQVYGDTYTVSIDYTNDRLIRIVSDETGEVIERSASA